LKTQRIACNSPLKDAAQDRAYDLWLDCFSQRDIAESIGKEFPAFRRLRV
jgi:hypothetical protein